MVPTSVRLSYLPLAMAAAVILMMPPPGVTQTARGVLVDASSGLPIEGAMVWLVGQDGVELPARLTDAMGRFFLSAPADGRYHLKADRIGYDDLSSESFDLTDGATVDYRLSLQSRAFSLEGMTVEGGQRCRVGPEEGAATANLWYEARAALAAAVTTEREELLDVRMESWRRVLEPRSLRVLEDERETVEGRSENPIHSYPADLLQEGGYVQETPDGDYDYFVPDADVLLSDSFLDQHCFTVQIGEGAEEGLIGLAFRPIPGQTLPDVEGVLWLDAVTAELRHLDVDHTRHPFEVRTVDLGARVEFEGFSNGTWVVRRWWLRVPRMGIERRGGLVGVEERVALTGIIEYGGELTDIRVRGRPIAATVAERAALSGVVVDSAGGEPGPVYGATVYLDGTEFTTTTDARGRYRIEGVPAGSYRVALDHPQLRSRAVGSRTWPIQLNAGVVHELHLALPTAEAIRLELCPSQAARAGVLTGRLFDPTTLEPLGGGVIQIEWGFDLGMRWAGSSLRDRVERVLVTTDQTGAYFVCDIPAPTRARLWPIINGEPQDVTEVRVLEAQVVTQDLGAGSTAQLIGTTATAEAFSSVSLGEPGEEAIRGVLRDGASGQPMMYGTVELLTSEGEVAAQAVADSRGLYRLAVPAPGTYQIRGWRIDTDTVSDGPLRIAEGEVHDLDFLLRLDPIEVAGLEVTVAQRTQRLERNGFYQRAQLSAGTFMTTEQIRTGVSMTTTDVLARVPGIQVNYSVGPGQPTVMLRAGVLAEARLKMGDPDATCRPVIHLDGVPVQQGGESPLFDLESIPVEAILGIEVYGSPAETPAQYSGISAACGVIVIWTR